ncbi:MAG: PTS sugar transporter subunit IIA [Candidatus Polarisedimenticolaceae bacterium]|nr:PTS sugar transporter subunit IIA [Candidatus Polarisedimenticolaceae bacterium]
MFPENFIVKKRIRSHVECSSKKRVLEQLGELLVSSEQKLTQDLVFDKLLERERLGTTALGYGIALPHARMAGVTEARGAFIQLCEGIDFGAVDRKPVDLAFALLVPEEATDEHLQLLAKLAAMFSNMELCESLRNAASSEDLLGLIEAWEKQVKVSTD